MNYCLWKFTHLCGGVETYLDYVLSLCVWFELSYVEVFNVSYQRVVGIRFAHVYTFLIEELMSFSDSILYDHVRKSKPFLNDDVLIPFVGGVTEESYKLPGWLLLDYWHLALTANCSCEVQTQAE